MLAKLNRRNFFPVDGSGFEMVKTEEGIDEYPGVTS